MYTDKLFTRWIEPVEIGQRNITGLGIYHYQIGNGVLAWEEETHSISFYPSQIPSITAGGAHTCSVTTSGGAYCWGSNTYGQVGDGTTSNRPIRRSVSGLTGGVSSISAGREYTCALTTSGGVKCWGRNNYGQLGDGTTTDRLTPVDVSGLTSGGAAITTGGYHTCARTSSAGIKCWGRNTYGQVGDGTTTTPRTTPVTVSFATATYTYDANHKHAVASLSTGETYTYDANGNMITRVENGSTYTQTFDAENRLISVTVNSQTTQFVYDGDGNLVKKINPDNSKTLYVGGLYEVNKNAGGTVTRNVTYYPMAGAMRINVIGGSNTVYYLLKDHLGSASTITDMTGNVLGDLRYYPYGETRLAIGSILTDRLYTGQREIMGLGIYHYGSRFYSPKLGRFLSADTIVPNPANPQDLNRYSYVRNNPIRYTDPSGHRACITQAECADMGITPNGGNLSKPRPQLCTRNCGGADKPNKPQGNDGGGGGGTPTNTPCSVVFIACSNPSPTPTPFPTTTPTPYDGPAYSDGPTLTPTPTQTSTPIPLNPDDVSQGIGVGQWVADAYELVKTGGQTILSKGSIALGFLLNATGQWIADSNNGLGLSERAFRALVVGGEGVLTGVVAGVLAGSVIVAGGGPENLVADALAVLVFADATLIATDAFERLNENYIFPWISGFYP